MASFKICYAFVAFAAVISPLNGFNHQKRILGGIDAPSDEFLFAVSLQSNSNHVCGGSILNERWIVTTAQCVESFSSNPQNLQVSYGSHKRSNPSGTCGSLQIVVHPRYDNAQLLNDIALIKTSENITFISRVVSPAKLPFEDTLEDDTVLVSGWGKRNLGDSDYPEKLQYKSTKTMALDWCYELLSDDDDVHYDVKISDDVLCIDTRNGVSISEGDEGSAMVWLKNNELVGIASWREPNGEKGTPNVYTRVYSHLDWINHVIAN